ncbi:MAG: DUF6636 domain-containing protein [Mycobacterium sp.]
MADQQSRVPPALVMLPVLFLLAGCGGDGGSSGERAGTAETVVTAQAPAAPRAPTPDRLTSDTKSAPADETVTELRGFTSPSGNVGCYIDPSNVRCDISERDWAPPSKPASCEWDYGQGITLQAGDEAGFVCAGDTALGGGESLGNGRSIAAGSLVCESAESGMTCRDNQTGHGFVISREAYQIF